MNDASSSARVKVLAPLDSAVLEPLAQALGEAATGAQLTRLMKQVGLPDDVGEGATKWKRVYAAFVSEQTKFKQSNRILMFVKAVLAPPRFAHSRDQFEGLREEVNRLLAFCGFHLYETGRLGTIERAKTVSQAQERASRLRSELLTRRVHADVLRFCKEELVVPNYFHAVFEATKSVAEKLRAKSGLASDGAELVDAALGLGTGGLPLLAFTSLQTETERSEHKGFAMLLKGMFGAFRNVTAHAPKITWPIQEQDALDVLTLASLLHRRLDAAVLTGRNNG
jgi:uncharacterized protein (TIGR02391 family)